MLSGGKPSPEAVVTMVSPPQSTTRHTDSQWRTTILSLRRGGRQRCRIHMQASDALISLSNKESPMESGPPAAWENR